MEETVQRQVKIILEDITERLKESWKLSIKNSSPAKTGDLIYYRKKARILSDILAELENKMSYKPVRDIFSEDYMHIRNTCDEIDNILFPKNNPQKYPGQARTDEIKKRALHDCLIDFFLTAYQLGSMNPSSELSEDEKEKIKDKWNSITEIQLSKTRHAGLAELPKILNIMMEKYNNSL